MPILFMMTTSHSQSGHLDRKSLKRPDSFTKNISRFFNELFSHVNAIIGVLAIILVVGASIAYWMNHREHLNQMGQNALYAADQSYLSEMKELQKVSSSKQNSKKGSSKEELETSSFEFKKLDVDAKFPETVKHLKTIDQDLYRSRAAFEARLKLGNLYLNHGEPEKSAVWFDKAVSSAPRSFEKIFALASLGYANENLGKYQEAIAAFQKAVDLGEVTLRADLLLSLARCNEAIQDVTKARSIYDQVLVEFPNSDYSQSAELFKSQLPVPKQ